MSLRGRQLPTGTWWKSRVDNCSGDNLELVDGEAAEQAVGTRDGDAEDLVETERCPASKGPWSSDDWPYWRFRLCCLHCNSCCSTRFSCSSGVIDLRSFGDCIGGTFGSSSASKSLFDVSVFAATESSKRHAGRRWGRAESSSSRARQFSIRCRHLTSTDIMQLGNLMSSIHSPSSHIHSKFSAVIVVVEEKESLTEMTIRDDNIPQSNRSLSLL